MTDDVRDKFDRLTRWELIMLTAALAQARATWAHGDDVGLVKLFDAACAELKARNA